MDDAILTAEARLLGKQIEGVEQGARHQAEISALRFDALTEKVNENRRKQEQSHNDNSAGLQEMRIRLDRVETELTLMQSILQDIPITQRELKVAFEAHAALDLKTLEELRSEQAKNTVVTVETRDKLAPIVKALEVGEKTLAFAKLIGATSQFVLRNVASIVIGIVALVAGWQWLTGKIQIPLGMLLP